MKGETRGMINEEKKRSISEVEKGEEDELNLTLSLLPPGLKSYYHDESVNSNYHSEITSTVSEGNNKKPPSMNSSCGGYQVGFSSLILMGCSKCYLYVMVPERAPRCPRCGNISLMDVFRQIPAKRMRI